jgi:hypothetical protein
VEPPKDKGNENQRQLVGDNNCWDEIAQSGSFKFDKVEKQTVEPVGKYHCRKT